MTEQQTTETTATVVAEVMLAAMEPSPPANLIEGQGQAPAEPTLPLTPMAQLEALSQVIEKMAEPKPIETKLIPIELHNVSLRIDLRVASSVEQKWEETQSIIARLKAQFGESALIEELSQVLLGVVEKVSITRAPESHLGQPVVTQAQQQQPTGPTQVTVPQTAQDFGNYAVESTSCPWHRQSLKNIDPINIYKVLYESPQHRALLSAQDVVMMENYYRAWYDQQQAKTAAGAQPKLGGPVSFDGDDIPF